jgi:hypothetical protein
MIIDSSAISIGATTNTLVIPLTFTSSETTANFAAGDITTTNGTIGNFQTISTTISKPDVTEQSTFQSIALYNRGIDNLTIEFAFLPGPSVKITKEKNSDAVDDLVTLDTGQAYNATPVKIENWNINDYIMIYLKDTGAEQPAGGAACYIYITNAPTNPVTGTAYINKPTSIVCFNSSGSTCLRFSDIGDRNNTYVDGNKEDDFCSHLTNSIWEQGTAFGDNYWYFSNGGYNLVPETFCSTGFIGTSPAGMYEPSPPGDQYIPIFFFSNSASPHHAYTADFTASGDGLCEASVSIGAYTSYGTGINNQVSNTFDWTYDGTPPFLEIASTTPGIISGSSTNISSIAVTFTSSEDTSDFDSGDVTVVLGSLSAFSGSGEDYTASFDSTTEGTCSMQVAAGTFHDDAGNPNTESALFQWTYDTTPPTMDITSSTVSSGSSTNVNPIAVTFTSSQDTSDFASGDVTPTNGSISAFSGSGSVYTASFTPALEGTCSMEVAAGTFTDDAGNTNTASLLFQWTYDTTSPTMDITSSMVNSGSSTGHISIDVTFTSSADTSDFASGDVSTTNGSISAFSGSDATYTATFTSIIGGTCSILVAAGTFHDEAGNPNTVSPLFEWTYDTTLPAMTISSSAINSEDTTNTQVIPLTFTSTEVTANFVAGDITTTNGTISSFESTGGRPNVTTISGYVAVAIYNTIDTTPATSLTIQFAYLGGSAHVKVMQIKNSPASGSGDANLITLTSAQNAEAASTPGTPVEITNWELSDYVMIYLKDDTSATQPVAGSACYIFISNSLAELGLDNKPTSINCFYSGGDIAFRFSGLGSRSGSYLQSPYSGVFISQLGSSVWEPSTTYGDLYYFFQTNTTTAEINVTFGSTPKLTDGAGSGSGMYDPFPTGADYVPLFFFGQEVVGGASLLYSADFTATGTGDPMVDCEAVVLAGAYTSSATGNSNSKSNTFQWTYDTIQPTMTIASSTVNSGSSTNVSSIAVTFTSSEDTADFASGDVTVTNGSLSAFSGSGSVYTASFDSTAVGTCSMQVAAGTFTDDAGNTNTVSLLFQWTYDTTPPTMAITSSTVNSGSSTNVSSIAVTFTSSEDTADFASGDVTPTNGSLSAFSGSGSVYTASFDSTAVGTCSMQVAAGTFHDDAGNPNTESALFQWTYDTTPPTMDITSSTVNSGSSTNQTPIDVTFTSSEDTSDFASGDVTVVLGSLSAFSGSGSVYTASFNSTAEGTCSMEVDAGTFHDDAGNPNTASLLFQWTYELTPPTMTITSATISSGSFTSYISIDVTFTSNEDTIDFASGDITVTNGSISGFSGSGTTYTATFTSAVAGICSILVEAGTFHDEAGNPNTVSNTFEWTYTDIGPTMTITSHVLVSGSHMNVKKVILIFRSSMATIDFTLGDISFSGGTISSFSCVDCNSAGSIYTAIITIDEYCTTAAVWVEAGKYTDVLFNLPNTASNTFSWTYVPHCPVPAILPTGVLAPHSGNLSQKMRQANKVIYSSSHGGQKYISNKPYIDPKIRPIGKIYYTRYITFYIYSDPLTISTFFSMFPWSNYGNTLSESLELATLFMTMLSSIPRRLSADHLLPYYATTTEVSYLKYVDGSITGGDILLTDTQPYFLIFNNLS